MIWATVKMAPEVADMSTTPPALVISFVVNPAVLLSLNAVMPPALVVIVALSAELLSWNVRLPVLVIAATWAVLLP